MREYMPRIGGYGIGWDRYKELSHMCRQYAQDKAALNAIRGGSCPDVENDRSSTRGSTVSDTTASRALRAIESKYARRVNAIEQAAMLADRSICKYIIKSVSLGLSYDRLIPQCPCGRAQFYRARRKFFRELDIRY